VQHGQLIHESVLQNIERTKKTPKALLYDSLDWKATERLYNNKLIEQDIYSNASALMDKLGKKNNVSEVDVNILLTLIASGK
jgi:DNA-binding TFAR19-related protein (PDSD5 family)